MKVEQLELTTAGGTFVLRGLDGNEDEIAGFVQRFVQRVAAPDSSVLSQPTRRVYIEPDDIPEVHGQYASIVDLTVDGVEIEFNCWALDKLVQEHWKGVYTDKGKPTVGIYRRIWNDALAAVCEALDEVLRRNPKQRAAFGAFSAAVHDLEVSGDSC